MLCSRLDEFPKITYGRHRAECRRLPGLLGLDFVLFGNPGVVNVKERSGRKDHQAIQIRPKLNNIEFVIKQRGRGKEHFKNSQRVPQLESHALRMRAQDSLHKPGEDCGTQQKVRVFAHGEEIFSFGREHLLVLLLVVVRLELMGDPYHDCEHGQECIERTAIVVFCNLSEQAVSLIVEDVIELPGLGCCGLDDTSKMSEERRRELQDALALLDIGVRGICESVVANMVHQTAFPFRHPVANEMCQFGHSVVIFGRMLVSIFGENEFKPNWIGFQINMLGDCRDLRSIAAVTQKQSDALAHMDFSFFFGIWKGKLEHRRLHLKFHMHHEKESNRKKRGFEIVLIEGGSMYILPD